LDSYYDQKPWLKTYPDWLPGDLAVPKVSVLDQFLNSAEAYPDDPCVFYFDQDFSYREVRRMSLRLSVALENMGIEPGDRIIVVMQNIPQAVVAFLAIWMRGAVVVPLNPMYTGSDLKHYLADSGAAMFICQDDLYWEQVQTAVADRSDVQVITTSPLDLLKPETALPEQLKGLNKLSLKETSDFMELIGGVSEPESQALRPEPEDLASLVYTGGGGAWSEFARKISVHRADYHIWNVGLPSVLGARLEVPSGGPRSPGALERLPETTAMLDAESLRNRRPWLWLVQAAGMLLWLRGSVRARWTAWSMSMVGCVSVIEPAGLTR